MKVGKTDKTVKKFEECGSEIAYCGEDKEDETENPTAFGKPISQHVKRAKIHYNDEIVFDTQVMKN
ncbi:hypothetical protein Pmar_PMAR001373 [Perkinsus marinus ATCC 50983]|uniref:Uncharacterized protein n=1 Tax=Perkinsus marinus (strain ATCC 50983 / TXsc) TaxID=423536 RepID=C5KJI9_PERM5|nr:hypothetical protein Pmar_PMAR001373 [Perkinsus marinus ATCC 50983]EER15323.1 hypothetical protein Pmar_PMAR001373 [Perkinsus marinus ATCC 50983]|eukprot:XP_002783527.1 hypothetical protein Pmar_PMAR001373 [Perkinsus marinus ATCC 50983]